MLVLALESLRLERIKRFCIVEIQNRGRKIMCTSQLTIDFWWP